VKSIDTLSLFPKAEVRNTRIKPKSQIVPDKEAGLNIIQDNVSPHIFDTWFKPIQALKWENNTLTVLAPSTFFYEWIETKFNNLLRVTIDKVIGHNAKLNYDIVVDNSSQAPDKLTLKIPAFQHGKESADLIKPVKESFESNLHHRYSLDNYITGDANQLAASAAMAVSQNPGGTRFNPLVVYGDTGLGKTHLVQGIGNKIIQSRPDAKVLYTNSEKFTMDFISAIQNNSTTDFINHYRSVDVLIVDDIQFFAGKEKTQDNFFHTFNALHQAGKQLILTSDVAPKELKDVDDRLISRFQWGLTVDIQSPDLEMRMAILQKKSLDEGLELPVDILEFIARNITSSIRELEGVLISLIAKVTLDKRQLNMDVAKEVVYGVANVRPKTLTIDDIKDVVSAYYKLPVEILESKSRKHEIALARQMSMYLTKQLTQMSLKSIGQSFGGRDHSTVLHSCQTIENYLVTDKTVKNSYEMLFRQLKGE
jgi:chromosomal replication initiator protein